MDRSEIIDALTALAGELERRGVVAEMYVVGGAAIALAFDERRATRDIDAVFEPKDIVYEAAGVVAERLELPGGWLNDAVKGFLEGDDPAAAPVLDLPGLRCLAASPETLLALKVLAHRIGEDEADLRLLAGELGLETASEVLAIGRVDLWRQARPRCAFLRRTGIRPRVVIPRGQRRSLLRITGIQRGVGDGASSVPEGLQ